MPYDCFCSSLFLLYFVYSSLSSGGRVSINIFPDSESKNTGIGIIASSSAPTTNLETLRKITPYVKLTPPSGVSTD